MLVEAPELELLVEGLPVLVNLILVTVLVVGVGVCGVDNLRPDNFPDSLCGLDL